MNLQLAAKQIKEVSSLNDLASLLAYNKFKLGLLAEKPVYQSFKIPKSNGDFRLIENPNKELKLVMKKLNQYFQAVYYYKRPSAVYGFCISLRHEEERNIINNAKKHLGKHFLYNIDIKDFFHSISIQKLSELFEKHFANFDDGLAETLCKLCSFQERLPMGAPTSPILSNFAAYQLDLSLLEFCKYAGISYTRYADDLSFSSSTEIGKRDIESIKHYIEKEGFAINSKKEKLFLPQEEKVVTGIVLKENELALPANYLKQVEIEIERLKQCLLVEQRYQTGMSYKKLNLFKQELRGKLNFATMVMPKNEAVLHLFSSFEQIISKQEAFESVDWLDIPYL